MKKAILPIFFLMIAIQWFVPAEMIWKKEAILTRGSDYKFRTEPIDPNDPFVGKYIILHFREPEFKMARKEVPKSKDYVYVSFKNSRDGFAEIEAITDNIPKRTDYLKTSLSNIEEGKDSSSVFVYYPFTRFYMEESKAPEAEIVFGQANRDSLRKAYAVVALYNGNASIRNVYINDTTIADILKRNRSIRRD